jgi:type II secretory pathway component PulK
MVELVELGSGSAQARARRVVKRRPQEEWKEQGNAHGLLTSSYDDGQARLVRTAVYGIRETSKTRAGKRVMS